MIKKGKQKKRDEVEIGEEGGNKGRGGGACPRGGDGGSDVCAGRRGQDSVPTLRKKKSRAIFIPFSGGAGEGSKRKKVGWESFPLPGQGVRGAQVR